MSVDNSELLAFQNQIQALKDDIPEIMDSLAVGEGRYARDQARKICKEENIVNTGDYRRNFKSGTKAIRAGNSYKIDVFNNLDYAKPLEYGFRITSFLATGKGIPSNTRETTLTAECTSDRPAAMFAVISPFGAL